MSNYLILSVGGAMSIVSLVCLVMSLIFVKPQLKIPNLTICFGILFGLGLMSAIIASIDMSPLR